MVYGDGAVLATPCFVYIDLKGSSLSFCIDGCLGRCRLDVEALALPWRRRKDFAIRLGNWCGMPACRYERGQRALCFSICNPEGIAPKQAM
jgi:hypothetical protein